MSAIRDRREALKRRLENPRLSEAWEAKLRRELAALQAEQDELVKSCIPAVWHQARKFWRKNTSLDMDELASAGYVGLVQAALLFEPERGWKFCTYAMRCIWSHIILSMKADHLIAVPSNYHSDLQALRKGEGVSGESVYLAEATRALKPIYSLDTWGLDEEDDRSLAVCIPGKEEEPLYECDEMESLRMALKRLPERDRQVLLGRMAGRTLLEIGREWGVSRERIRQLERRATARLKAILLPKTSPAKCSP